MNKNYYEILQVDRNASPEIIEKAYKTLAKKYHPDLQADSHKKEAEETLKIINQAYETLSNPELKMIYDENLNISTISQAQYDEIYRQNQILKDKLNHFNQNSYTEHSQRNVEYENQINSARKQAYHDAYVQDLKNRGYKVRYKKSFSDYMKSLISIIIVIFILFILWQIPFIKNYFINLYNTNSVFKALCDLIINIFN